MKLERVEILGCVFEWCILTAQKVWSSNKFIKLKCLCNRWVFVWNRHTSKEMVQFVHEVHLVFAVTHSTFYHILCVWNDDTMPSFNLFRVHLYYFSISGSLRQNKSLNAWKIENEVRKGWNFRMCLWLVHIKCTKSLEFK